MSPAELAELENRATAFLVAKDGLSDGSALALLIPYGDTQRRLVEFAAKEMESLEMEWRSKLDEELYLLRAHNLTVAEQYRHERDLAIRERDEARALLSIQRARANRFEMDALAAEQTVKSLRKG